MFDDDDDDDDETALFQVLFILSLVMAPVPQYSNYVYPEWSIAIGWLMVVSSLLCIPAYAIYKFLITPGSVVEVSTCTL
jgi:hypothetical protein